MLQPSRDQIGRLNFVVFDVDHPQSDPDLRIEIAERLQLVVPAAGKLEHEMIHRESIEERNKIFPKSFLDRLAAIISEAEVQRALSGDAFQDMIDRGQRPLAILGMSGDVRFVEL